MSIIEQLKSKQGFTEVERVLADYILHHVEDVGDMPISELAYVTHTSNSGIVRLCRKVGMSGYRELRVELVRELERRRTSITGVDASRPFGRNESCATVMRMIATLKREALEDCYAQVSPEAIDRMAQLISSARHVFLYGSGDTGISVEAFNALLTKVGIVCIDAGQHDDFVSTSYLAGEGDVALFVSNLGRGFSMFSEFADFVHKRGCTTVILTGMDPSDPRLSSFDHVVTFPVQEVEIGAIGPYYSQTCIRYVLDCVYGRVYALNYDHNLERKAKIESALKLKLELESS